MSTYCTPAEVRTQIEKTGTTGSASDEALNLLIAAISEAIDRYYNRPDPIVAIAVATARQYAGTGHTYQPIDECVSITTVEVKDSPSDTASDYVAWASTDYIPFSGDPESPDFNRLPYTHIMIDPSGDYDVFTSGAYTTRRGFPPMASVGRGVPTVRVTARWGYSLAVPAPIKEATIGFVARLFKQGQSAWADTLASGEMGRLIYQQQNSDLKFLLDSMRLTRPPIG